MLSSSIGIGSSKVHSAANYERSENRVRPNRRDIAGAAITLFGPHED
jgi:hypothetical protein